MEQLSYLLSGTRFELLTLIAGGVMLGNVLTILAIMFVFKRELNTFLYKQDRRGSGRGPSQGRRASDPPTPSTSAESAS